MFWSIQVSSLEKNPDLQRTEKEILQIQSFTTQNFPYYRGFSWPVNYSNNAYNLKQLR